MVDVFAGSVVSNEPVSSALSRLFTGALPIDGVSISVVGVAGTQSVISSSNALATALELMQFELGEGAHSEALTTARSVLIPDVAAADMRRWPIFAGEVESLDVGRCSHYR